MAVAFDASGHIDTGASTTATSLSGTPITVGSGSNRAIGVFLGFGGANALPTGITVTCGGTSMAAITGASVLGGGGVTVSGLWFGLVNPTSGTPTIAAAWTGGRSCIMQAISVTGNDQTGGATSFAHGTSVSSAPLVATSSITITSATGNLTTAAFLDDGATGFASTSATQDAIFSPTAGNISGAFNHTAGNASNVMTATYSGTDSTTNAGFDFVAAAGGAAPFYKSDWGKQFDISGPPPQAFVRNPLLYPNPIPFVSTDRRDTRRVPVSGPPQSLPLNINLFTNPIPFKQTDWSTPNAFLKVPQPRASYNNALYTVTVVASPFYQNNWPIPTLQEPSVPFVQQNTLINLLAQPLIGPDWSTSKFLSPRAPDATQQTNINLFTNPIPFSQMDWSTTRFNPAGFARPQAYNLSLYTITVVAAPFFQNDWSTTRFQTPRAPDLPLYNQSLYTVTVAAVPFVPVDWSRLSFQRSPAPDQQSLNLNLFTNPIPFAKYDYSLQVRSPTAPMDRSQPPNINLLTPPVGPMPFSQYNWTPASKPTVRFDKMSQNFAILVPFTPPPPSMLVHNLPFHVTVGKLKSF